MKKYLVAKKELHDEHNDPSRGVPIEKHERYCVLFVIKTLLMAKVYNDLPEFMIHLKEIDGAIERGLPALGHALMALASFDVTSEQELDVPQLVSNPDHHREFTGSALYGDFMRKKVDAAIRRVKECTDMAQEARCSALSTFHKQAVLGEHKSELAVARTLPVVCRLLGNCGTSLKIRLDCPC